MFRSTTPRFSVAHLLTARPARLAAVALLWVLTSVAGLAATAAPSGSEGAASGCGAAPTTFAMDLRGLNTGTVVLLLDAAGQVVGSARATDSAAHLPFAGLPAGDYSVQIDNAPASTLRIHFNGRRITGQHAAGATAAVTAPRGQ